MKRKRKKETKTKEIEKRGTGPNSRGNRQAIWEISKCLVGDWQRGTGTVLHCGSPSQSLRLTTPPRTNLADVKMKSERFHHKLPYLLPWGWLVGVQVVPMTQGMSWSDSQRDPSSYRYAREFDSL